MPRLPGALVGDCSLRLSLPPMRSQAGSLGKNFQGKFLGRCEWRLPYPVPMGPAKGIGNGVAPSVWQVCPASGPACGPVGPRPAAPTPRQPILSTLAMLTKRQLAAGPAVQWALVLRDRPNLTLGQAGAEEFWWVWPYAEGDVDAATPPRSDATASQFPPSLSLTGATRLAPEMCKSQALPICLSGEKTPCRVVFMSDSMLCITKIDYNTNLTGGFYRINHKPQFSSHRPPCGSRETASKC